MQEIVKYHNDFNRIKLPSFTEQEQNMLFGIVHKIRDLGLNEKIEFTPAELLEFSTENLTNKALGDMLVILREKFFKADFTTLINDTERNRVGRETINLFNSFVLWYPKDDEKFDNLLSVELSVNPRFAYLINELTANFTRFELAEFIALSGKYTKTLYRLLKQYRQTGMRLFKWDEFLEIMDTPKNYRQIDIDTRILKPAIKELTLERNLFDIKRIPFKDLKYTKLDKNQKPNPRGRNKVCFIKFEWKPQKVQEELEAEAKKRIAQNLKNHIPTSDDYNAQKEFENYKGVEISFYSEQKLMISTIINFNNETNQLICCDKKANKKFFISFENLQKANAWIAEKLQGIY